LPFLVSEGSREGPSKKELKEVADKNGE